MNHCTRFLSVRRRTKVGSTSRICLITCGTLLGLPPGYGQATQPVGAPATAAPAASVEPIVSMRESALASAGTAGTGPRKSSYELAVNGTGWLDSGVMVSAGETLAFSATGTLTLPDGRGVGPEGLDRGWKDLLRQFPLNQAKTGALIGRVSDVAASVPFAIGAEGQPVMPTSGRLYLRANLSDDLAATGEFKVVVKLSANVSAGASRPAAAAAAGSAAAPAPIARQVSPGMFAAVPRRVVDQAGDPGDMVNFAMVGSAAEVSAAFRDAGWVAVDKTKQDAVLHGLLSTLSHEAYVEMPMSTLYLFGRPQDLSFARADPLKVAAERHHLRMWQTTEQVGGRPLWVGSATHDIGFERDQRNGGTTHKIDPKVDDERTFLLQSFDAAGDFSSAAYVTPGDPLREAKTATGGSFFSDGRILVMDLKAELK